MEEETIFRNISTAVLEKNSRSAGSYFCLAVTNLSSCLRLSFENSCWIRIAGGIRNDLDRDWTDGLGIGDI